MADYSLQATPCPSIWIVEGPSQPECTPSPGLPVQSWFPWHEEPPCHQARGKPSLDSSPSTLHREVGYTFQSPVQGFTGPQRCMPPLMCLDSGEIIEASILGPADDRPITPPTTEEEAVLLGDKPEPQEALEFTTSPPEWLKPQNWRNQLSSLMVQVHLPLCPWPQTPKVPIHHSHNTRRAWHRAKAQHLLTPNPDHTNDWAQAYLDKWEEPPN